MKNFTACTVGLMLLAFPAQHAISQTATKPAKPVAVSFKTPAPMYYDPLWDNYASRLPERFVDAKVSYFDDRDRMALFSYLMRSNSAKLQKMWPYWEAILLYQSCAETKKYKAILADEFQGEVAAIDYLNKNVKPKFDAYWKAKVADSTYQVVADFRLGDYNQATQSFPIYQIPRTGSGGKNLGGNVYFGEASHNTTLSLNSYTNMKGLFITNISPISEDACGSDKPKSLWSVAINGNLKMNYYARTFGSNDYARWDRPIPNSVKMTPDAAKAFAARNSKRNVKVKLLLQNGGIDSMTQAGHIVFAADIKSAQVLDPSNNSVLASYAF